jgi:hypothetical protein
MAINTVEDSVDVWEEAVMDNLKKWHSEIKVLTTVNIRIMSSGTQLHVVWQIGTNISKRGRWHVPPEYCYLSSKLHGIPSNNVNFTTQDSPKLSKALHLSQKILSQLSISIQNLWNVRYTTTAIIYSIGNFYKESYCLMHHPPTTYILLSEKRQI